MHYRNVRSIARAGLQILFEKQYNVASLKFLLVIRLSDERDTRHECIMHVLRCLSSTLAFYRDPC